MIFADNQLFDLSPDGIVVLDERGQILHANQSFLGLAEEAALAAIVGTSLGRWLGSPGGDLSSLVDSLHHCGSVRRFPITIKGTLGGDTAAEVSAVLKSDPTPAFIVLYIHDVYNRLETPGQSEMLLEFLRKLCTSHPDLAEHEKSKMRFCSFLHFSIACAIEKWRHLHVPQESLLMQRFLN